MKQTLKMAMSEALVDGWHAEWQMWQVVHRGWVLSGKDAPDDVQKYTLAAAALRVDRISAHEPARGFVQRNMRKVSDMLWGGAQTAAGVAAVRKLIGIHNQTTTRAMTFSTRERDYRHDWNTVK